MGIMRIMMIIKHTTLFFYQIQTTLFFQSTNVNLVQRNGCGMKTDVMENLKSMRHGNRVT